MKRLNRSRRRPATSDTGTAAERFVGVAREQATQAADALRKGEFMRDTIVDEEASSDDRLIALLCYITQILIPVVMPVIVLLSESSKRRSFQRYHAVQSLALSVLFMAIGAAVIFGTGFLTILPIIGWIFSVVGFLLLCLAPIAVIMVWMALGYLRLSGLPGQALRHPRPDLVPEGPGLAELGTGSLIVRSESPRAAWI